jgi:hypothetical protein
MTGAEAVRHWSAHISIAQVLHPSPVLLPLKARFTAEIALSSSLVLQLGCILRSTWDGLRAASRTLALHGCRLFPAQKLTSARKPSASGRQCAPARAVFRK